MIDLSHLTEEEIEHIINFKDDRAGVKIVQGKIQQRVYNTSIIKQLKRLYKGTCQLCGVNAVLDFNANITEVHHIDHFSVSQNNNSNNLIVLCPNHHRLIHKLNPTYNPSSQSFVLSDGRTLKILIDYRCKYPEVSLQELSEIMTEELGYPISKSGLNHRFRRILKIADFLKEKWARQKGYI